MSSKMYTDREYTELAAAVIELHNNIAGSFAAPRQARATTETSPLDALKSISRMADDMREDARERLRAHGQSSAAAANFAEGITHLYAILKLQDAMPARMRQVVEEIYSDAMEHMTHGRDEDTFIAYEDEVPF